MTHDNYIISKNYVEVVIIKTEENNFVFEFDNVFFVEKIKRNQRILLDSFRRKVFHFEHLKILFSLLKTIYYFKKSAIKKWMVYWLEAVL